MPPRAVEEREWMEQAHALAARGLGRTAPNPPVGCVLVKNGRVVGRGYHRRAGGPHAEVVALEDAGRRARGATAYVTLEPCCRQGRTGPCTEALIAAGVERVVVACRDPNPEVRGRGLRRLVRAGIEVEPGLGREACEDLIRGFRQWIVHGRPWCQLKLAATLDGRIAAKGGASKWLSSPVSRRRVQAMRARSDAVLVGIGTVLDDDPRLTVRSAGAHQPLRVVLDRRLRTPSAAKVVSGPGRALIVCGARAPQRSRRRLEAAGAEVVAIGAKGKAFWSRLLRELARRDVLELLIEGGAEVATSAIRASVVNSVTIFYTPFFMGSDGLALVGELGVRHPARARRLRKTTVEASGPDLVWTGWFE